MTSTSLDIQVEFSQPKKLAKSLLEPDRLEVDFKEEFIFIDRKNFKELDRELEMKIVIQ